jgi:mycothiol synthase
VNVRRPTDADVAPVTALIRAAETSMAGEAEQGEDDLRTEWAGINLERDAWLVDVDGRLAAYAALYGEGRPLTDGYVHPDFHGRGIGSQLIDLVENEARARGFSTLQDPVFGADERAHELLQNRGYREARRYYRMMIDLDRPPPAPEWPPGLEVGPVAPGDLDRFHSALDDAFAQEWGHEPERDVDWREIRERRSPDQTLWFTVKDGDQVAAAAVTEEERWGAGWISSIGVREQWRRRGIGHALLLHCFGELYARGKRRIALGVDSQNPTGATRLYERAGMHVAYSAVFFEKELAA